MIPLDGFARLTLGLLVQQGEHVLQALHLQLGLRPVRPECLFQLSALRRLCHLWQSLQDLVLSEIDIL